MVTELKPGRTGPLRQSPPVAPWLYWALFPWHRLLMRLYFSQIVIRGLEHLPQYGPVVWAPKHYSRWDPLVLGLLCRKPVRFMTRADQFVGWQGWLISILGGFPIDTDRPAASLRRAIALLQAGETLVMFPEGGIERQQPLRELKPGLARMVLQAETGMATPVKIPIVAIGLRYSPDVLFRGRVIIDIAPPLYTSDYQKATDKETAKALTEALHEKLIAQLFLPN
jgi:1-acyl-sn-glycerol-3-phosphate acyltransferase